MRKRYKHPDSSDNDGHDPAANGVDAGAHSDAGTGTSAGTHANADAGAHSNIGDRTMGGHKPGRNDH